MDAQISDPLQKARVLQYILHITSYSVALYTDLTRTRAAAGQHLS